MGSHWGSCSHCGHRCRSCRVVGGGDEATTDSSPASSDAPTGSEAPTDSTAGGADTWDFPLSYAQAKETLSEEAFNAIDWGTRCDAEKGTIAVPDYFAPACMAPFTGDNGERPRQV